MRDKQGKPVKNYDILKKFIVFEGQDGAGTTTQLKLLDKRLGETPHWVTAEPTDHPIGKLIRSVLMGKTEAQPETLARLYAADRHEHLFGKGGIRDHLDSGNLVVCDRYVFSSLAYQAITCGFPLPWELNRDFPLPECLIYFRLPAEVSMERLNARGERDIFENSPFQQKVNERYERAVSLFRETGMRIVEVDATASVEEIHGRIWRAIQELPI
jgi:dTMP kinase